MEWRKYFTLRDDLHKPERTIELIKASTSFKGASVWILIFAIFIASLGLNVNSTAVIIGAMLVSPLMGPIIGMGLAVGINDLELLRRAVRNYLVATLVAVATATIYFLFSPFEEAGSELLARTAPTLYDVLIAFMGGAAGIVALSVREKGNVIPGVAIATALMPPLCTAGFGLAQGNMSYFMGAFFLYFINTVFIALSTFLGVKYMQFPKKAFLDAKRERIVHRTLVGIVVITMIPAGWMTWNLLRNSYFNHQVGIYLRDELHWEGSQVVSHNVGADSTLRVVVVGRPVSTAAAQAASEALRRYSRLEGYRLRIVQGSEQDSLRSLSRQLTHISALQANHQELLDQEARENAALAARLAVYEGPEQVAASMAGEMRLFFPSVTSLSLLPALRVSTQNAEPVRRLTAIVTLSAPLKPADLVRLERWLQERTKDKDLEMVVR